MLIGIDGNEANTKERVGVHQYSFELLWGLYKRSLATLTSGKLQDNKNEFIIYLKNPPREEMPLQNESWKYKIIPGERVWVLSKLIPTLLKSKKLDVFFSPTHYLPFFSLSPMICTIHDLGYLKFSGQFKKYDYWQLKLWSAVSIIISKYIICPSKSTAGDIVRHYTFAAKKVKVVNHGYDSSRYNRKISLKLVRRVTEKYRIGRNYILFLSTLKPSKNIEGLLLAYKLLKSKIQLSNFKLVIAGKKGWLYESIFQKVRQFRLEKDVVFTDYIPEQDKPALIAGARVLVLPCFWEGFGMDVLNAMACGTPVVVSRVASLPEVAGDAGVYVDPYNIESITAALKKVLSMSQREYNKQVELGLKQAQKFSWEKTARETLKVLKEAIKRKNEAF